MIMNRRPLGRLQFVSSHDKAGLQPNPVGYVVKDIQLHADFGC
jgi:hypothetical protein